jgi:hypothetical protein
VDINYKIWYYKNNTQTSITAVYPTTMVLQLSANLNLTITTNKEETYLLYPGGLESKKIIKNLKPKFILKI